VLQGYNYCPVLKARAAEIKALEQLPAPSRSLTFPTIAIRPWPNAKKLERTWEKITGAMGLGRFALDLDHQWLGRGTQKPAALEFEALFDPSDGYSNYYDLVKSIPTAIPVLRVDGGGVRDLDRQLDHASQIERGLVVRVEHDHTPNPILLLKTLAGELDAFVAVIDLGWSLDLLSREAWASQIIQAVTEVASLDEEHVELVVCGSSFPEVFTNFGARKEVRVTERAIFDSLVRRHNAANLKYGDWASTRPQVPPTPMNPTYRIDLPLSTEWVCFRQVGEEQSYGDIANRLMVDRAWPASMSIWGTKVIEWTANDLPGSIRSPAVATAVRVNIHMHRQAQFGVQAVISDVDEPWTDE